MNRFSTVIIFAMACLIFTMAPAHAQAVVLGTLHYPPYIICDKTNNTVTGLDVRIVRQAFKQMNQAVIIRCLPWKRVLHLAAAGKIDGAFPAFYTPQRSRWADFISSPLHYDSYGIATVKGKEFRFDKSRHLVGKTLVVEHGHFISQAFATAVAAGAITTVEAKHSGQALQILQRGSVDGYLDNVTVIGYTAKQLGIAAQITILEKHLQPPQESFLLLAKHSLPAQRIRPQLEQVLNSMRSSQLIQTITDQYLLVELGLSDCYSPQHRPVLAIDWE